MRMRVQIADENMRMREQIAKIKRQIKNLNDESKGFMYEKDLTWDEIGERMNNNTTKIKELEQRIKEITAELQRRTSHIDYSVGINMPQKFDKFLKFFPGFEEDELPDPEKTYTEIYKNSEKITTYLNNLKTNANKTDIDKCIRYLKYNIEYFKPKLETNECNKYINLINYLVTLHNIISDEQLPNFTCDVGGGSAENRNPENKNVASENHAEIADIKLCCKNNIKCVSIFDLVNSGSKNKH